MREQRLLADHDVKVMHCPGSNLKLGSGIAPVAEMRARGVDGVARRRRRRVQQPARHVRRDARWRRLQAVRRGPGALPPATSSGWRHATARARSAWTRRDRIDQAGKRADLILVDADAPHLPGTVDPYSTLVYAARGSDVRLTMVDGEIVVDSGRLTRMDRGRDCRARARRGFRARRRRD